MIFKMNVGDISNISVDKTPFHEGYGYITYDGRFFVDLNIGTAEAPINKRVEVASDKEYSLTEQDIQTILAALILEFPIAEEQLV